MGQNLGLLWVSLGGVLEKVWEPLLQRTNGKLFVDDHLNVLYSLWPSESSPLMCASSSAHAVSRSAYSAPWCGCDFQLSEREFHAGFTVPESTLRQSDDFSLKHVTGTVTATQGLKVAAGHDSQEEQMPIRQFTLVKSSTYLFQEHVKSHNEMKTLVRTENLCVLFCACLEVIMTRHSLELTVLWNYTVSKKKSSSIECH